MKTRFEYWIGGWPYVATTVVLAYAALAAALAGTAVSYYGAKQQAATAKSTSDYNAKVQENQTIQADMDARENAKRQRERNLMFASSNRAANAASGITEAGSPLEVLAYNAGQQELAVQDAARQNAQQFALGMNTSAQTRVQGANLSASYNNQATGTILSGIGNAAGNYGRLSYAGAA